MPLRTAGIPILARGALPLAAPALALLLLGACGPDWDLLDPSLGGAQGSTAATATGAGGGTPGSAALSSSSAGSGGADPAGSSGAGGAGGGAGGAGAGPSVMTVEYGASIAECIDVVFPNPQACEDATGAGAMNVDSQDSQSTHPNYSFLRFDLDGALAGKQIVRGALKLVVASFMKSSSTDSGEVWEVEEFDQFDLLISAPDEEGSAPLAKSNGAVTQGQTVEWTLPPKLFAPGESVFLGVYPLTSDGVDYWNRQGASPPVLVIEYQ